MIRRPVIVGAGIGGAVIGGADALLLLAVAAYGAVVFATGSSYGLRVFSLAGVYAIAAIGAQLVIGQTGALSLAQGTFMGLGAYVSALAAVDLGWDFGAALPASVLAPVLLALLVAYPLRRLRSHGFALATLVLSQLVLLVAVIWQGVTGGANGFGGVGGVALFGLAVRPGWPVAALVWAVVAAAALGAAWAMRGRHGLAYAMLRAQPAAAAAIGLDAGHLRLRAFLLGAGLAGVAGALHVHIVRVASPDLLGFPAMVTLLTIVMVGGRVGVAGAVAGAVLVTGLPEWVRPLREATLLAYGVLLLAVIVAAPDGLLGALRRAMPSRPGAAPAPLARTPAVGGAAVVLDVVGLSRRFGGVRALDGVSLRVAAGEVLGLIGPNGSGKTTFVDCVTGLVAADAGRVTLGGAALAGRGAPAIARAGLGRSFQAAALVDGMTALDAVAVAVGADLAQARRVAMGLLGTMGVAAAALRTCGSLPQDTRRRIEIARALARSPRLLLLDEPASGLTGAEQADLARRLRALAEGGMALLVVEHDMGFLALLADRLACLDAGVLIAEGRPAAVRADPRVVAAYLGTPAPLSPAGPPAAARAGPLLSVRGLEVRHGAVVALAGIDLAVAPGEAVALLGANGAGKTTLLRAVMGQVRPATGDISYAGASILRLTPDRRARAGIGICPEGRRVFAGLSVAENLAVGCQADARTRRARMTAMLELFPALAERRHRPAGLLSGGQQQMLAIARALMGAPRLLLLDEPSLGLSPLLTDAVMARIPAIAATGTAVLLAEQNAARALAVCGRAYVLRQGRVVAEGTAAEVAAAEGLRAAFLGG